MVNVTEVAGLKEITYQNTLKFIKMKTLKLQRVTSYFGYILLCTVLFSSCADSKDFIINGKQVTVEPYGWFDLDAKNDSINYKVNTGNVVWCIILSETIVVPVILTGNSLYEPVSKK